MPRYGHRSDPQMHVADSVMIASVDSRIFGSSRFTTRTSPGEYITTPRTSHVLSSALPENSETLSNGISSKPAARPADEACRRGDRDNVPAMLSAHHRQHSAGDVHG